VEELLLRCENSEEEAVTAAVLGQASEPEPSAHFPGYHIPRFARLNIWVAFPLQSNSRPVARRARRPTHKEPGSDKRRGAGYAGCVSPSFVAQNPIFFLLRSLLPCQTFGWTLESQSKLRDEEKRRLVAEYGIEVTGSDSDGDDEGGPLGAARSALLLSLGIIILMLRPNCFSDDEASKLPQNTRSVSDKKLRKQRKEATAAELAGEQRQALGSSAAARGNGTPEAGMADWNDTHLQPSRSISDPVRLPSRHGAAMENTNRTQVDAQEQRKREESRTQSKAKVRVAGRGNGASVPRRTNPCPEGKARCQ
jgi:hypothetical protein